MSFNYYLKKGNKNGLGLIIIKISYPGISRLTISTKLNIPEENWELSIQRVNRKYRSFRQINKILDDWEDEFKAKLLDLVKVSTNQNYIKEDLKKIIPGNEPIKKIEPTKEKTFFQLFDEFLDTKKGLGEQKEGTAKNYRTLKRTLQEYEKSKRIKLSFDSFNMKFYEQFRLFLLKRPNPKFANKKMVKVEGYERRFMAVDKTDKRKGEHVAMFNDTISKYIININAFLNWSFLNDYHDNGFYKKISPKRKNKIETFSLTQTELFYLKSVDLSGSISTAKLYIKYIKKETGKDVLGKLEKKEVRRLLFNTKAFEKAMDLFLFMCFSIQRFSDATRFDKKNLKGNVWEFLAMKTEQKIRIPLIGYAYPALEILKKYDYQFEKTKEQPFNRIIKKVFKILDMGREINMVRYSGRNEIIIQSPIYDLVSSHCGRRTGTTILIELGVPPHEVQKLGGWKDPRTMYKYINVSEESINRNLENAVINKAI